MRRAVSSALGLGASLTLAACGGQAAPPKHPIGEMSARATAKLDVLDLVVDDLPRAARLRQIYLSVWQVAREFDLARARSLVQARTNLQARAQQTPSGSASTPELAFGPSLEVASATYERYTKLMIEARSLLTEAEFRKLDALR